MNSPEFPIPEAGDLQHLEATHNRVEYTLGEHSEVAFSLVLPKGWVFEEDIGEQQSGIGQVAVLGRFAEPRPDSPALIQVMMSNVPMEIPLRDWVQYQAAKQDIELTSCEHAVFNHGQGVDAGGVLGPPDRQHVVRIVGMADGGRIFMVMGMVARERYPAAAADLALALYSFALQQPTGSARLEQWGTIEGGEPAIRMAIPGSWDIRDVPEDIEGKAGFDVVLAEDENMLAYLRVKVADPEVAGALTPDQALQTAIEEMTAVGVVLHGAPEDDIVYLEQHDVDGLELARAGAATIGDGPLLHYRIAFLRRDGLDFTLSLLAPQRSNDVITWMRAKRMYEIAFMTLESV